MFSTYDHTVYDKALYSPDGGLETLAHPGLSTFCTKRVNKLIVTGNKNVKACLDNTFKLGRCQNIAIKTSKNKKLTSH